MTGTNYRITDTLDAAVLTIVQQALNKIISPDEAERRIRRAERLMMAERLRGMGLAPTRAGWWERIKFGSWLPNS